MRILILSFYFPPDLSAGSFRAKALVDALRSVAGDVLHIDVITTMPNRYQSVSIKAPVIEEVKGLRIRRLSLPSHQSGMLDQAKAFMSFAWKVISVTRGGNWDIVFATSGRLMTAVLAANIAKRSKAALYLDIRDLFTDTMTDLLKTSFLRHLMPVFRWLERRTFQQADRLNVVSVGFLSYVQTIIPKQSCSTFMNGIDDDFLSRNFEKSVKSANELPLVVYAGNIGQSQGLHNILPQAALLMAGKARFRVIGDGGRRKQLEAAISDACIKNVEILKAMPRSELFTHYRQADVLFIHLNDHSAFHKVLPSKLFEYCATGKPILAGVAGYAGKFMQTEVPVVEVFEPCDAAGMAASLERLLAQSKVVVRDEFCRRFSRTVIMREMARDILAVIDKHE